MDIKEVVWFVLGFCGLGIGTGGRILGRQ